MESSQFVSTLQSGSRTCATCGGAVGTGEEASGSPPYVFAIGRIEARFPSLGVEKEFAQATGRGSTAGLTDRQTFQSILTERSKSLLARQLCWVLSIEGLETYLLVPRDSADLDLLLDAVRGDPRAIDLDVVVGVRGPIAPPQACNGLQVPIVVFDQIWSFDRDELISAIPRPEQMTPEQFEPGSRRLYDRIMQMADNAGATDEHRAINYLASHRDLADLPSDNGTVWTQLRTYRS